VAGPIPGLVWLLKVLVTRPFALARATLVGGLGLAGLTLAAWVGMLLASILLGPTLLVGLLVHGIAFLAGADLSTHSSLIVLESLAYLLLGGVVTGRVLARGLHAHGVYQAVFIRRLYEATRAPPEGTVALREAS
jgi:hypothetical protein